MKNTILFDLDDTLYDGQTAHSKAMKVLAENCSKELKVSEEEFKILYKNAQVQVKMFLKGTASSHNRILYMQRIVENHHKTVTPELILNMYRIYWDEFINNSFLLENVIETLEILKQRKVKIAVVTDLTAFVQLRKIAHLGLSDYVDYIVTSEETGSDKPHPSNYLLALDKLDSNKNEAIIVGDNPKTDIEGAFNLGIRSVLMNFGSHAKKKSEFAKPDFIINNIKELVTNKAILS